MVSYKLIKGCFIGVDYGCKSFIFSPKGVDVFPLLFYLLLIYLVFLVPSPFYTLFEDSLLLVVDCGFHFCLVDKLLYVFSVLSFFILIVFKGIGKLLV